MSHLCNEPYVLNRLCVEPPYAAAYVLRRLCTEPLMY
jgi:hypothetical protein